MRFGRTLGALTAALSLVAAPAFSQAQAAPTLASPGMNPSIGDILSGTLSVPLSLKLGDLDGSWRRMTITGSVDLGTVTQMVTALLGSAGVGVYYTRGASVTVGNASYLVAYRTQPKVFDITNLIQMGQNTALSGKPPAPEKLTADTPLALTLLNLQAAGSLTDIKPFDLNTEVTNSANAVKAFNDLMTMMGTMGGTPSVTPPVHPYKPKPKKKYPTT